MMIDTVTLALAGAVMALWIIAAAWALTRGILMQRRARFALRRTAQMAGTLETAPAVPLVVRSDGRLEGTSAAARLLGLDSLPTSLFALLETLQQSGDFSNTDQLGQAVAAAQNAARDFDIRLSSARGRRSLTITGSPAPQSLDLPGGALLWISDTSETQIEIGRLSAQREEAMAGFSAISSLIETAPFPMWVRDTDFQLMLVNRAYVQATEAQDADNVIRRQTELVEPIAGVSARSAAQEAAASGEALSRSIPVTVAGKRRMMDVLDIPIEGIGVAGYAIDRQELEDVRSEYRRFADARRSMLDQMSAAVAEFGQDRTLRFVNRPFLSLFQIDEEWVASAPAFERVLDRFRDSGRTPEVRDFPGWRAERRGWFASPALIEESWLLRDGTHLRTVAQPTPDGGLLLIFEDRTEQIQLASARDTLLRVRTATFDNLFEAVSVFAPDGRLNIWNQRFRRLLDLSEEYLTSHPRLDALFDKVRNRLEDPRQANVLKQMVIGATGERQQRAGRIAFRGGQQFDFAAIPLPDGNALFTLIDVTDARRIERALRDRAEALEAADRVKTDFLSRISYELRTPLTSIGGYAQMLKQGYAGDLSDAARDYVSAILSSTEVLGQQIDTVLDLAQSEAGTLPLERRPAPLSKLVLDAVMAVKKEAEAADVELVIDVKAGIGEISGDAKRLRQIFDLMLGYALAAFADRQHVPEGGRRIIVHGEGDAAQASIIVSDNGPGVEQLGTQAVSLALAKQLVSAHDGRFEVVHRAGEGSLISVILPR